MTAPESSPLGSAGLRAKPAERDVPSGRTDPVGAIAREIARDALDTLANAIRCIDEHLASDAEQFRRRFIVLNERLNTEAAAIQRGDGQDWRKLSVTAVAAENPSVAEYIAQLERTAPPADEPAAKPNETSGATPKCDAYEAALDTSDDKTYEALPTPMEFARRLERENTSLRQRLSAYEP